MRQRPSAALNRRWSLAVRLPAQGATAVRAQPCSPSVAASRALSRSGVTARFACRKRRVADSSPIASAAFSRDSAGTRAAPAAEGTWSPPAQPTLRPLTAARRPVLAWNAWCLSGNPLRTQPGTVTRRARRLTLAPVAMCVADAGTTRVPGVLTVAAMRRRLPGRSRQARTDAIPVSVLPPPVVRASRSLPLSHPPQAVARIGNRPGEPPPSLGHCTVDLPATPAESFPPLFPWADMARGGMPH